MPIHARVVAVTLTVAALVLTATLLRAGDRPDAPTLLFHLAIIAATALVVHMAWYTHRRSDLHATLTTISDRTARTHDKLQFLLDIGTSDANAFVGLRHHIDKISHPVLRQLYHHCLSATRDTLPDVSSSQIVLTSEFLILESYQAVWDHLVSREEESHPGTTVRAVHSTQPEIWLTNRGMAFLKSQAQFTRAGGTVIRYMIGPPLRDDLITHRSMQYMIEAGITVYYIDYTLLGEDFVPLFDFLSPEGADWVFQWVGLFELKNATFATDTSECFHTFEPVWQFLTSLVGDKKIQPVQHDPSFSEAQQRLRDDSVTRSEV